MGNWSIGKLPPKSVGRRWIIEYIVLGKLTHCGEKTVLDSYLITYTKKKKPKWMENLNMKENIQTPPIKE